VAATVELQAGSHHFELRPWEPVLMGIVNTNPGSFSDEEHLSSLDAQLAHAHRLLEAGAGIIDVGFDSGVTHGRPRPLDEQLADGLPLVERLVAEGVPVSVDTPFREVARACLEVGAGLINDVSGLADVRIAEDCAEHGAALVILHTRIGHRQERFPEYDDVVADVETFFRERIALAEQHGLPRQQVVLDPGYDYDKRPHHTVETIRAYPRFAELGLAFLSGVSRKYFTGIITGARPADRLPETLATVAAVREFPGFLRVHDVDETARFLAVTEVIEGTRPFPEYTTDDPTLKWHGPAREANPAEPS
jgi:dihydropteroate synthase